MVCRCLALSALLLCLSGPTSARQPAAVKPQPTVEATHPWLLTATQTRASVLAELAPKIAQTPYDTVLPLLQKSQAEIAQSTPDAKKAALGDAYDAALSVVAHTDNHLLAARLFDGFILPLLPFASPNPVFYNSRLLLLKTAVGVYGQAEMPDRQLAALRLLRPLAADNENLSDWVNLQFAAVYARRGQYQPAMDALSAVKSPGMMGPTAALPVLEQKQQEEQDKLQAKQKAAKARKAAPTNHAKRSPKKPPTRHN